MFGKEKKPVNKEELNLRVANKALSVISMAAGGVLVCIGMKCGERYATQVANSLGFVKFFDDTGKELNMLEASDFIKSL